MAGTLLAPLAQAGGVMRIAHGTRDESGTWHPDDPTQYQPLDVHGIWPWSTLDQTQQAWRERRAWWNERGVDDIAPRSGAAGMIATGRHARTSGGVSRFDPVLAELLITWFSPAGGLILDPFAGGPVRGIVAGYLGREYLGVDLLGPQLEANLRARDRWLPDLTEAPRWIHGDALTTLGRIPDEQADYVLTCPPYWNRERYSDDPRDLSAMTWARFLDAHAQVAAEAARCLRPDRFLTWVISDVRDHRGHLRHLPWIAVEHVEATGLRLVNEQVLIEPPGLRAKTTRPPWEACRTTTRRHQYVLTFVKGDRRKAAQEAQCSSTPPS